MLLKPGLLTSIVIAGCIACGTASEAVENRLKVCMASFQKEMGVSPDIAYTECSKRSFSDCIKETSGKKFVAQYVGKKEDKFIVDAGNDFTRWMEGWGWRAKKCEPHGEGPRRDEKYTNFWGVQKRTLYRQGACQTETVELDQINSLQEAEVICKGKPQ